MKFAHENTLSNPVTHLTKRTLLLTKLLFAATCLFFTLPSFGQDGPQGGVRPLTTDWRRVQAIPSQSRIRVVGDKNKVICFVDAVTDDHLTCSRSRGHSAPIEFRREEVKQIKLTHRARSGAEGAAVGFALGAAAGAAVFMGVNDSWSRSGDGFLSGIGSTTSAKAAGAGAVVGGVAVGIVGGAVGYGLEMFEGTVIYQRPHS